MAPSIVRMPVSSGRVPAETRGERSDETPKRSHTLDEAVERVVYGSDLPCKHLADAIGVRPNYLRDCGNPNDDQHLRLELVAPLTRASGNPAILHYLAEACGYVLIRKPEGPCNSLTLASDVADITRPLSLLLHLMSDTLADGDVCKADAERLREVLAPLIAEAHDLDAKLVRLLAERAR